MEHSVLEISASPKQISKLRNGHKVRVKKGKGCSVLVDPLKYSVVSRTFNKGKGAELQLSPQEIQMNKTGSGMGGYGLFAGKGGGDIIVDKLIDKVSERAVDEGFKLLEKKLSGKGMRPMKGEGQDITDKLIDKVSERAIDEGFKLLEKKLSGKGMKGSPEMKKKMADLRARKGKGMKGEGDFFGNIGTAFKSAWTAPPASKTEQDMANFINRNMIGSVPALVSEINPKAGQRIAVPLNPYLAERERLDNRVQFGSGMKMDVDTIQKLNEYLGTNMDYLKRTGLDDAVSNAMSSQYIKEAIDKAKSLKGDIGMGLYASRSSSGRAVRSQVGLMGNRVVPDFLESKPFFENNQLRYTLPVAYQKFHK